MNNSGHIQHSNGGKSGWNCSNSWCFTVILIRSCLTETSNDLPDLVVPIGFSKRKHPDTSASGQDCTDRIRCMIRFLVIICRAYTTRFVSILVRSDRLPNIRISLRRIVFDTGRSLCRVSVKSIVHESPRTRSDDFLLHNSFIGYGY